MTTSFDAEAYLVSLEPLGWRFGLERIRRLVSVLGMPQHRFASIHVVGTNGKSSVAEMAGALLEAHGKRTGVYLSPHTARWSERVRIGGAEIDAGEFAAAAERVAQSIEVVNRTLADGESVTQFEAVTATAFVALASARVELGRDRGRARRPAGRHQRAALGGDGADLGWPRAHGVAGRDRGGDRRREARRACATTRRWWWGGSVTAVRQLAERTAAERNARLIVAGDPDPGLRLSVPGAYQRRNFAVAAAAAEATLGALDPDLARAVAEGLELPGRVQLLEGDPPLILDAAHNPDGARALAEALPEAVGEAPVVACLAILADKDAAGVLAALAPRLEVAVCTELPAERLARAGRPGARALEASRLAALAAGGRARRGRGRPRAEGRASSARARWRASGAAWRWSPVRTTFCPA